MLIQFCHQPTVHRNRSVFAVEMVTSIILLHNIVKLISIVE